MFSLFKVFDIYFDLKIEMMDYIKSLPWLNNLTKNFMVEKIKNITLNHDLTECHRNHTVLAQMYKGVGIDLLYT